MTSQDGLNLILAAGFLIITACIVYVAFYLVQALKSIRNLSESLDETTQNIKDKIQLKALAAIPALLIALIAKLLKKRG